MQETIGIKASVFVVLFLLISGASCAQGKGMKESYIESNWGLAFIGDFEKFSLELSPIFFGDLLQINEEVQSLSLYSAAMLNAGHRWIF